MKPKEALNQLYMCALGWCERCTHKDDSVCSDIIFRARQTLSMELEKCEDERKDK